jgi:hypothetical protein
MKEFIELIEKKRQDILNLYKKTRNFNKLLMIVVGLGVAAIILFLMPEDMTLSLLLVGGVLILLFVYSRIVKQKIQTKTYDYLYDYYRSSSTFFYQTKSFENVQIDEREGMLKDEFDNLGLLNDVTDVISRNKVSGLIEGVPFNVYDVGVRAKIENKNKLAFYGKIFVLDHKNDIKDKVTVYVKAKVVEYALSATTLANPLFDDSDYAVYGAESDVDKVVTPAIKKWINGLKIDDKMADVTIVFTSEKTYLAVSYHDAIMNVAYERPLLESDVSRFQDDLGKIALLVKNTKK